MRSVFQLNKNLIRIVYVNDQEIAEEVFYHDLDDLHMPYYQ